MKIQITGIPGPTAARLRVAARARSALRPAAGAVRDCRVVFTDENGPKGGADIRCTIDVGLIRRADIHVAGLGTSAALAFREAVDRIHQRLDRVIGAGRASARHPKKYFAAIRASMQATL
jgi:putative sigma-54 modulation protein